MTFVLGYTPWNKGKKWNDTIKNKISETVTNQYKSGKIVWNKGIKMSKPVWNKGTKMSQEVKDKISKSQKERYLKNNGTV